jgi:hypothetical protein
MWPKMLKIGGCLAIHLRSLLNQSSQPLDQNFAHFKIQMNFGRIHQILFLSFLSAPFSSPTRPRRHPSRLFSLHLSYSSCLIHLDTKKRGEARGNLAKIALPSLSHTSTAQDPQPASSCHPGGRQDPTCQPLLSSTSPFPLSPVLMPTRAHRWRSRPRQHAWPPSLANSLAGPSTP